MSSNADQPYIEYRWVENLFCRVFGAKNVSRQDSAVDAIYKNRRMQVGINIKTFVYREVAREKIAEFVADYPHFKDLPEKERIIEIARLRNQRLEFVQDTYQVSELLYHCIVRGHNQIHINEFSLDYINIDKITLTKPSKGSINFTDNKQIYSFVNSKNTLYRQFDCRKPLQRFDVQILADPFAKLADCFGLLPIPSDAKPRPKVYLPLYSTQSPIRKVSEKSGLNQWNASGRERNDDEAYIPIPIWIHRVFKDFFPPIDKPFQLFLSDDTSISVKVCQQGGKALMSNPNKLLGEWLLRGFMKISHGQLVTYEMLETLGVDSVVIEKYDDENFGIDFAPIDSYEDFKEEHHP
jgi:hypothetical protein